MIEVVPQITDGLRRRLLAAGYVAPETIPVSPLDCCEENHCWTNVPRIIEQFGGSEVTGWIVWQQENGYWNHFEAHAVWQKPDGEIIDPTPKTDGEREIVFSRAPLKYRGFLIPSQYLVMSKSKDVKRYCHLLDGMAKIHASAPSGTEIRVVGKDLELMKELNELTFKLFPESLAKTLAKMQKGTKS